MSLSSGKASGKTCWCESLFPTPFDGGAGQTEHERDLHKRIAELEAELADGYACHVAAHAFLEERADNAEAEIERLSLLLQKPREKERDDG